MQFAIVHRGNDTAPRRFFLAPPEPPRIAGRL
jgi:hypothetical protein